MKRCFVWRRYILAQYQTRSEREALFAIVDAHIMQAKTAHRGRRGVV